MQKKSDQLQILLDAFQSNAYPAMIDDLAEHLGVAANSLRRLGVGWAPIVEFKKGKNFRGWWVNAERDAKGELTGLSLRSQDDVKVMYPGSKHGLIYEVNPNHEAGVKGYDAGPQNWIRTMDAGQICPICNKPDGCLLSADNPSDPKAVVCIRVQTGSTKPLRFGHLHLLKPEGVFHNESVIRASGSGVLLVVEGMSDTATSLDFGFDAIGRPSDLACQDELADLIRGYPGKIIIVGENDKKPDGREPGKDGAIAAFERLRLVHRDVKWLMPPENVKDLRVWKVLHGLTAEKFLAYAEAEGHTQVDGNVFADHRPLTIAINYLDDKYKMGERYTICRWQGRWYQFNGACYGACSEDMFIAPIRRWAHDKKVMFTDNRTDKIEVRPLVADTGFVSNMVAAIQGEVLVPDTRLMPCWINGVDGPDPQVLIAFYNGLLDVDRDRVLPTTPDYFTTHGLPVAYEPASNCPLWLSFLQSTLGEDQLKIHLLQEWMGYCMTPDMSQQKMMFMRGPAGAGKGTILHVLENLVGTGQYTSTSIASLSSQFGLGPLVGKLVATLSDAKVTPGTNSGRGLENILSIVGHDSVGIDRKHMEHLEAVHLTTRLTIVANEFLELPDYANALARRLLILEFTKRFLGKNADTTLRPRLLTELPGIAIWALEGLKRLRSNSHFTEPESGAALLTEWTISTNPLAGFIEDCCDLEGEIQKEVLFGAWDQWSQERGMRPILKSKFYERVRFALPHIASETFKKGSRDINMYRGVTLKPEAMKRYTGEPPR